jgi:hypothetical protein
MRELLRQAYLFPAAVLMRPTVERIATLSWLCEHPAEAYRWHAGWVHKDRPSFTDRLATMLGTGASLGSLSDAAQAIRDQLNGLVHGDPLAANMGAILLPDGAAGFTVSKDLGSPGRATELAWQGAMYTVVLLARIFQCFPTIESSSLVRARESVRRHLPR